MPDDVPIDGIPPHEDVELRSEQRRPVNKAELDQVLSLDASQRYDYFFKNVIDFNEIWFALDGEGIPTWPTSTKPAVYVWPREEFARACVSPSIQLPTFKSASIQDSINRVILDHDIWGDDLPDVAVFPARDGPMLVDTPGLFIERLRQEWAGRMGSHPDFDPEAPEESVGKVLDSMFRQQAKVGPKGKLP